MRLVCCVLLAACAEPAPLPSIEDDAALSLQIDANDKIDTVAMRLRAFVHGEPAAYWHLGVEAATAMPLYQLCARTAEEDCAPIDHPPIVELLPGDEGYSPFGRVYAVRVAPSWRGRIASVAELDGAVASGEAQAPVETTRYLHCPIASSASALEVARGATITAERIVYARGMEARCFDFGGGVLEPDGEMIVRNVYVLRRDGDEMPLVETARMQDLNGDGDLSDSNNVFGVGIGDSDYTPLWRVVRVVVPTDYASIDTYQDQTRADYTRTEDMFTVSPEYEITPMEGQVIDFELTDFLLNCPIQIEEGGL
jgi:hypothetical protein